jgi:hypothetical protein
MPRAHYRIICTRNTATIHNTTLLSVSTGIRSTALKKSSSSLINDDRRDYFRIDDKVLLDLVSVDDQALTLPPQHHFRQGGMFNLLRELRNIDAENNHILRTISEQDRELEYYLRGLNQKIELIASSLMQQNEDSATITPQTVSLSEGGISFDSDVNYAIGDYVAVQLTLLPERMGICVYLEICNLSDETPRIGANFIGLKEGDRQVLARHIMQVQINHRRLREQQKEQLNSK